MIFSGIPQMVKSRQEIWRAIGLNGGNVNKKMEHNEQDGKNYYTSFPLSY